MTGQDGNPAGIPLVARRGSEGTTMGYPPFRGGPKLSPHRCGAITQAKANDGVTKFVELFHRMVV